MEFETQENLSFLRSLSLERDLRSKLCTMAKEDNTFENVDRLVNHLHLNV